MQFLFTIIHLIQTGASFAAAAIRSTSSRRSRFANLPAGEPRAGCQQGRSLASVWNGRIVSDATLTSRVYAARKALGDTGQDQKLIRTIPRKGLRFIGDVACNERPRCGRACIQAPNGRFHERSRALALPDRPAIAVLPFINMSGDPEQEHFSDGISEDLTTALSRLRWFFVIARNSSFVYKGKSVHIKQVAEELGVGYVVEGSVRKAGDRVRITAQLNDVDRQPHLGGAL